jgi:hypothetical protein
MNKVNYKELQKRLFRRIHYTGEEIKNDFPNILRICVQNKAWTQFTKADGTTFKDLGEWLVYQFPNGVSMGSDRNSVSYEDALQLCKNDRELHGLLVQCRPSPSGEKGGRPKKETVNNINSLPKRAMGTSRAYIEQRLQREFPKIWKEYVAGNYKSARQAGIVAGIFKKPTPEETALKAFSKAKNQLQIAMAIVEALNVEDAEALKRWLSDKESK